MGFAIGNAVQPDRVVEVIASDVTFPWDGGFMGLGNDVGVYHLLTPITDVNPVSVTQATLNMGDVDSRLVAIGYGAQDNLQGFGFSNLNGTRRAGTQHLDAVTGQFFQLVFGTYDSFVMWLTELSGSAAIMGDPQGVMDLWNNSPILDGYEVLTGHRAGDAQTCFGDSGSPLIRKNSSNQLEITAVLSGGIGSLEKACDYGSIYSAMADTTRAFISQEEQYVDPCALTDGSGSFVSNLGSCNGDVASRCTGKFEGDRSLSVIDCSLLGQTCATTTDGQVGCFDAGSDPNMQNTTPHASLKQPGDVQVGVAKQLLSYNNKRLQKFGYGKNNK
jgi:hypothetical protein